MTLSGQNLRVAAASKPHAKENRRSVMKRTILAAAVAALFAGAAQAAVTEFIVYQHPNFQGGKQVIKGEVNILESGFAGKGSSLKVLGGYWEVCTEHHFRGDCYVLNAGDYPWLGIL